MTFDCHSEEDESVLKPIGELAALIERTSFADLCLFAIAMGKQMRVAQTDETITIGKND